MRHRIVRAQLWKRPPRRWVPASSVSNTGDPFQDKEFSAPQPIAAQSSISAIAGADHVYSQSSWARLAGVNQIVLAVLLAGLREMLR